MPISKNEIIATLKGIEDSLNTIALPDKKRKSPQDFTNNTSLVFAKMGVSTLITRLKGDK